MLVDLPGRGLIEQAALERELEQLLGCPVHVVTRLGAADRRGPGQRERIEAEALAL